MKLLGYARVSTLSQADDGISLETQRERILAWAHAMEAAVLEVSVEAGVSGKTPPARRPVLGRLLSELDAGRADGLIALRLDRVSRSTRDVIDLVARAEQNHWRLISVHENLDTASAMGRFVVRLLASLAELERDLIGERTREALAELKRQNKRWCGKAPFGTAWESAQDGLRATIVPEEVNWVERIRALASGGLGTQAIAKRLEKTPHPRGGRWTRSKVRSALAPGMPTFEDMRGILKD